jgi:putative membrane protein
LRRRATQCGGSNTISATTRRLIQKSWEPNGPGLIHTDVNFYGSLGNVAWLRQSPPTQIAHIAYTAGQIDIEAAQQAPSKSQNKDVREFATDMERDHKAVNEKALALVKKLNVTPEDNDTSKALSKQAAEKRAELAKLNGAAFDKAYIDNEVAYHKTVNDALENTLIPSATNPELKDLLTTGLKIFQGHQQHAEQVAAKLKY